MPLKMAAFLKYGLFLVWGRGDLNSRRESPSLLIDWSDFKTWVSKEHSASTVPLILRYAKHYSHVLSNGSQASIIHGLSRDKRRNVMAALANLSKYMGCYKHWNTIVEEAGLHWGKRGSLETVISILNGDLSETEAWFEKAVKVLPERYRIVLVFQALTGLRPSEACASCSLITTKGLTGYYNADLSMLEHFRFKDLFLRRSKNAYISFVPMDLLKQILEVKPLVKKAAIHSTLRGRGLPDRMMEIRKLYATTLREKGISQEIIDLLQGRVSQSIFLRHYYKPYLAQVREKVFEAVEALRSKANLTL